MTLDLFLKVFALIMFGLATVGAPGHPRFNYVAAGLCALTWVFCF